MPNKGNQLSPNQICQIRQTHAIVAQSSEDGEEALTCVKVENPRSKGNLKKNGTDGRPVKVLRGTGCTRMIVDRLLVPEVMVIPAVQVHCR